MKAVLKATQTQPSTSKVPLLTWPLGVYAEYQHRCSALPPEADSPVAGQVQISDVGEEDRSVGREARQMVVVKAQSLEERHVPEALPGEGCEEVPIQTQLSQGLQVDEAAGVDSCDGIVCQPQEPQFG